METGRTTYGGEESRVSSEWLNFTVPEHLIRIDQPSSSNFMTSFFGDFRAEEKGREQPCKQVRDEDSRPVTQIDLKGWKLIVRNA